MKKFTLIAEIGVNHNGSIKLAKKLINIAKKNNAHIVKFQLFDPDEIVIKHAPKAAYQKKKIKETHYEMLKKFSINKEQILNLMKYSKKKNIEFLCTAFDIKNLKFLLKNGMKKIKIPSGEITNTPLLKFISEQNKKVFLSTGMSTMGEIKEALHILKKNLRDDQITIMHCTSDYPTKFGDVNLNVISTFKREFNNEIGYSDHTLGSKVSCLALALGANVIEKHITLNNNHYGPDHKASLNPTNFKLFVNSLEETKKILGSDIKKPTLSEKKNKLIVRRSIVALKKIIKGEKFTSKNIGLKRPNLGLHPNKLSFLLKKNSRMNFIKDDFIKI